MFFILFMKTLYLIRHAEAAAKQTGIPDDQRPLTKEGLEHVAELGAFLKNMRICFDGIITSHATRALDTARGIADATAYPENKIFIEKGIYTAGIDNYLDILFEQPDEVCNLAFIGHNPHITGLANYLMKDDHFFFSPSSMVAMKFHADVWTDICLAEKELFIVWPTL